MINNFGIAKATLFLLAFSLWLASPNNAAQAATSPKAKASGQVFLRDNAARFYGVLVAYNAPIPGRQPIRFSNPQYKSKYNLREVPTQRLEEDLFKVKNSIRKYEGLNRPFAPSRRAPLILLSVSCAGALLGVSALVVAYTAMPMILPGIFVFLLVSAVAFTVGIIWFAVANSKYRRSPYFKKLQTLKSIHKAILLELNARSRRWMRSQSPSDQHHQLALSF